MPYIQFELNAKKKVPATARLAGLSEAEVCWGLLELWEWCWTTKQDTATSDHLAGLFGGDGVKVGHALVTFGFLEDEGGGRYRVRGAGRYLRIATARAEAGRKGGQNSAAARASGLEQTKQPSSKTEAKTAEVLEEGKQSPSKTQALSSSIEHRASKEEEEKPAADAAPSAKVVARIARPRPEPNPEHQPTVKALCEVFEQVRGVKYEPNGRDMKALSAILGKGHSREEVVRRFRIGLGARFPTAHSFADLAAHWNAYAVGEEPKSGAFGPRRADPSDTDWVELSKKADPWEGVA